MNISADNNMYIPVDENPGIFGDAPFKAENETWGKCPKVFLSTKLYSSSYHMFQPSVESFDTQFLNVTISHDAPPIEMEDSMI